MVEVYFQSVTYYFECTLPVSIIGVWTDESHDVIVKVWWPIVETSIIEVANAMT